MAQMRQKRKQRFGIFCVLAAVFLPVWGVPMLRSQAPTDDESSCRAFVQQFYDWYVALDARHQGRTTMDDALRLRPQLFDGGLLRMLKEDSAAQAKADEIVGLDFDPFFYSQDPSSKFEARRAVITSGHCRVLVRGVDHATLEKRVEPELVPRSGSWVFVNFHYSGSDLITILKNPAADRAKPIPK
jgi:hypothetical protein